MKVGVLAFHGDFAEHMEILQSLDVSHHEVRSIEDLSNCTHLIIPGGESTVMAKFLQSSGLGEEIRKRGLDSSLAIYGTCAGAILLARHVMGKHPPQTLELLDMSIERNAYGEQTESFEKALSIKGIEEPVNVSFIRAPRIRNVESGVEVLAHIHNEPVLVRSGKILAGTFHPELRGNAEIHRLFLTF